MQAVLQKSRSCLIEMVSSLDLHYAFISRPHHSFRSECRLFFLLDTFRWRNELYSLFCGTKKLLMTFWLLWNIINVKFRKESGIWRKSVKISLSEIPGFGGAGAREKVYLIISNYALNSKKLSRSVNTPNEIQNFGLNIVIRKTKHETILLLASNCV